MMVSHVGRRSVISLSLLLFIHSFCPHIFMYLYIYVHICRNICAHIYTYKHIYIQYVCIYVQSIHHRVKKWRRWDLYIKQTTVLQVLQHSICLWSNPVLLGLILITRSWTSSMMNVLHDERPHVPEVGCLENHCLTSDHMSVRTTHSTAELQPLHQTDSPLLLPLWPPHYWPCPWGS